MDSDFLLAVGSSCIAIAALKIFKLSQAHTKTDSLQQSNDSNASKRKRQSEDTPRKRTKVADSENPLTQDIKWVQAPNKDKMHGLILIDVNNVRGRIGFTRATVMEACRRFAKFFGKNVILEIDYGPAPVTLVSSENGIVHSFAGPCEQFTADDLIVMDLNYFVTRYQIRRALLITNDKELRQRCNDVVEKTDSELRVLDVKYLDRLFLDIEVPGGGYQREGMRKRQKQAAELHRNLQNSTPVQEKSLSRLLYSFFLQRNISSPPHWFEHYSAWVRKGRPGRRKHLLVETKRTQSIPRSRPRSTQNSKSARGIERTSSKKRNRSTSRETRLIQRGKSSTSKPRSAQRSPSKKRGRSATKKPKSIQGSKSAEVSERATSTRRGRSTTRKPRPPPRDRSLEPSSRTASTKRGKKSSSA